MWPFRKKEPTDAAWAEAACQAVIAELQIPRTVTLRFAPGMRAVMNFWGATYADVLGSPNSDEPTHAQVLLDPLLLNDKEKLLEVLCHELAHVELHLTELVRARRDTLHNNEPEANALGNAFLTVAKFRKVV